MNHRIPKNAVVLTPITATLILLTSTLQPAASQQPTQVPIQTRVQQSVQATLTAEASIISTPSVCPPLGYTLIAEEDFEDDLDTKWENLDKEITWNIISDGDNHVYAKTDKGWAGTIFGSETWDDYTVRLRIKPIAQHDTAISVRTTQDPQRAYSLSLFDGDLKQATLGVQIDGDWTTLDDVTVRAIKADWNEATIQVQNNTITVYINGELIFDHIENDEVTKGNLMIEASKDATAWVDDICIWEDSKSP